MSTGVRTSEIAVEVLATSAPGIGDVAIAHSAVGGSHPPRGVRLSPAVSVGALRAAVARLHVATKAALPVVSAFALTIGILQSRRHALLALKIAA